MLLILPMMIELIKYLLVAILLTQLGYVFLIFLLGNIMVKFYSISIYEKPVNPAQKFSNLFQKTTIGFGYFIHTRVSKFNWITTKVLLLGCIIIQAIFSIIIYEMIHGLLEWLFL